MSETTDRAAAGAANFKEICGFEVGGDTPMTLATRDFVFAEVWGRPGLDRRSRRWITLSCITAAGAEMPMRLYLKAALESGDITEAELREFVLQAAVYIGFPRASKVELMLNELTGKGATK